MMSASPILLALQLLLSPVAVDDARGRHAEAQATLTQFEGERVELATRGENLAADIAALKRGGDGPLPGVGDGRLQAALETHQALVGRITAVDREVEAARAEVDEARRALLAVLDVEIGRLRAEIPKTRDPALFAALRDAVAERAKVLRAAAPARTAAVELPAVDDSDGDPDALRELADEAEDHAERKTAEIERLHARLEALETRQRVLLADRAFSRELRLFGDDERNRRLMRATTPGTADGAAVERGDRTSNTPTARDSESENGGGQLAGGAGGGGDAAGRADPEAQAGANRGGAEDDAEQAPGADADSDGAEFGEAAEPEPAPPPVAPPADEPEIAPEPAPTATPSGADDGFGAATDPGGSLVVEDAFEPGLFQGDVDDLSGDQVEEEALRVRRQLEAQREAKAQLDRRADALRTRAEGLEQ